MDDWRRVPLGEVFEVQLGKMRSAGSEHGDQYQYLANRNVQWGQIVIDELGTMNFSATERERYRLKPGDLLVCEGGEVGRAALWSDELPECYFQNALHRLRATSVADSRFMRHHLEFAAVTGSLRALTGQTSIGHLPRSHLVRWLVPVPPLEEQRRIAEVLDTIDETIQATEGVIAKLKSARTGAIQSAIRDAVPTSRRSTVEREFQIGTGITLNAARAPRYNPVGYLRVANVQRGSIDVSDLARLEATAGEVKQKALVAGDLLVVEGHASPSEIGRCALIPSSAEGLLFQNHLFRLRSRSIASDVAQLILNAEEAQAYWRRMCSTSSGLHTINSSMLRRMPISVPARDRQRVASELIEASDSAVSTECERLEKLRLLRTGLAADLLSGRVRTVAA